MVPRWLNRCPGRPPDHLPLPSVLLDRDSSLEFSTLMSLHHTVTYIFAHSVSSPSLWSLLWLILPTWWITPPRAHGFGILTYLKAFSCMGCSAPRGHESPVFMWRLGLWHCTHHGYSGCTDWLTNKQRQGLAQTKALRALHKNCRDTRNNLFIYMKTMEPNRQNFYHTGPCQICSRRAACSLGKLDSAGLNYSFWTT